MNRPLKVTCFQGSDNLKLRSALAELRSTTCSLEAVLAQLVAGSHSVYLFFRDSLDPFPQLLTAV